MGDVFLSYASANADLAEQIAEALETAGYSVWWDRHLLSGDRFQQTIQRELGAASAVVVLWTRESVESEWVYSEARRGHQRGALVQLRAVDVTIDDLPSPFDALHCPGLDDDDALLRAVAELARVAPPPAQGHRPPTGGASTPARQERRTITALAVELEPPPGVDLEDLDALLRPYRSALATAVEQFGGVVDPGSGGSLIAFFGATRAHEDDPERAVRASFSLLDAAAELNAANRGRVTTRVGISTAPSLVSGSAVTGEAAQQARRLLGLADDGAMVNAETYAASRASIEYEPHGDAWRAVGSRGSTGEELADGSRPMVGREEELAQLQRSFARANRESTPQLVTIVAEPGLGKSRLVQAFSEWVDGIDELVTWRQGRCRPYGDAIAFAALADLVKAQCSILDSDSPAVLTEKLDETVRALVAGTDLENQVTWLTARLSPLVGLSSGDAEQEELFAAWRRFIEALASSRPTIMVVEDVHWADPSMLAFLDHLLEWAEPVPLLVVATARPELFDHDPTWSAGQRNAVTLTLSPLSPQEIDELVSGVAADLSLPAKVRAALVAKAGGNPLYAREFLNMASDGDLDLAAEVPDSVQALISARLDTVAPAAKQVVQAAAVVGTTFWAGAVRALVGSEEREVAEVLQQLVRRDFLRPVRSTRLAGEREFVFSHALIADVAYAQLTRSDRAVLHQAAAEWHEAKGNETGRSEPAAVARHFSLAGAAAGDPATAAALAAAAATWHVRAAQASRQTDAATALTHAVAAVDLTEPDNAELDDRLLLLANLQRLSGLEELSVDTLERAQAVAESRGHTLKAGAARVRRASVQVDQGLLDNAEVLARQAIAMLEATPGPELADAYGVLAYRFSVDGREVEAISLLDHALAVFAGLSDEHDELKAWTLRSRGASKTWIGDPAATADLDEALQIARERQFTRLTAVISHDLAQYHLFATSPELAVSHAEESLRVATSAGLVSDAVFFSGELAEAHIMAGRIPTALDVCEPATANLDSVTNHRNRFILFASWSWASLLAGDEDAADRIELAIAEGRGATDLMAMGLLVAAEHEAWSGSVDRTRTDELACLLADSHARSTLSHHLSRVARVLAGAGHLDLLGAAITTQPTGLALQINSQAAARAVLAEAQQDYAEGHTLYLAAADLWAAFGLPLEEAQALLGVARCQRALGRDHHEAAQRARELLTDIGALALLDRSDDQI